MGKVYSLLIAFEMGHHGARWWEWNTAFSSIAMEACGDQAAAACNQLCGLSKEKPSRKPCNHHHRVIQLTRSYRGHLLFLQLLFMFRGQCEIAPSITAALR